MPGGTSCPKLVIGKGPQRVVVPNSHDILEFADKKIDKEDDRLYPSNPEQLQLVQSWGVLECNCCDIEAAFCNNSVRYERYTYCLLGSQSQEPDRSFSFFSVFSELRSLTLWQSPNSTTGLDRMCGDTHTAIFYLIHVTINCYLKERLPQKRL